MRSYGEKKTQSKTKQVREENRTYTFFENTDALMEEYTDLHKFITDGIKAEGRDINTALPNFLSFLLVLHTSNKQVDQDTLMDAWEVSISNNKVPSDELSRYAWGVMKKMTEKVA
jgi:hypothetical protein